MKDFPYLSQALGNTIEAMRKKSQLTKTALADFSCLERRYLWEIEQGCKKPTVNAIYLICQALGISPVEFFAKVEDERRRLTSGLNG